MLQAHEELVKPHVNKVDTIQQRLFDAQFDLIKAYERQWTEMNYLIENGQWDEKAVLVANAYGLKVGEEMYIFQLDTALPFLPNTYYSRFKQYHGDFVAAKLLVSLQLRDVIRQIGDGLMQEPAMLMIRHYYHGVKIFAMQNKAKQVLMNTFRQKLMVDDSYKSLSWYSEEAIRDTENRTMVYLCPQTKKSAMLNEIAPAYPRINDIPGVIVGNYSPIVKESCENDKPLTAEDTDVLMGDFM
jgi:hypothetical protein